MMRTKRVGMMKNIDKQGRIVIPKEYRKYYHIDHGDEVFIVDTPDGILITNHNYRVTKIGEHK